MPTLYSGGTAWPPWPRSGSSYSLWLLNLTENKTPRSRSSALKHYKLFIYCDFSKSGVLLVHFEMIIVQDESRRFPLLHGLIIQKITVLKNLFKMNYWVFIICNIPFILWVLSQTRYWSSFLHFSLFLLPFLTSCLLFTPVSLPLFASSLLSHLRGFLINVQKSAFQLDSIHWLSSSQGWDWSLSYGGIAYGDGFQKRSLLVVILPSCSTFLCFSWNTILLLFFLNLW